MSRARSERYNRQEEFPLSNPIPRQPFPLRQSSGFEAHPSVIPLQTLFLLLYLLLISFQLETPDVSRRTFVSSEIGGVDVETRQDGV